MGAVEIYLDRRDHANRVCERLSQEKILGAVEIYLDRRGQTTSPPTINNSRVFVPLVWRYKPGASRIR